MNRTTDASRPAPVRPAEASDTAREEGLLRRWSRRKAQARQEASAPVPTEPEPGAATSSEAADAPETPAPAVLTDADMPPIESLDAGSDYRPFMSSGVSEELRTRALRRMFHSGLFQERCPLDGEYYDCHGYEPLGSVITYDMRAEMERAAQALQEQAQSLLEPDRSKTAASTPAPEAAVSTPRPDPSDVQES